MGGKVNDEEIEEDYDPQLIRKRSAPQINIRKRFD